MDMKPGDIAIFENGEEAAVVCVRSEHDFFRICFSNEVSGWIDREVEDHCWTYNKRGNPNTDFPNGNNIVKVIQC